HSYKDMATQTTPGLTVAAVPEREAAHDVIVCRSRPVAETVRRSLENGASAERVTIGTSSPRRSAQLRGALACSIEPVRGNVPTRIDKLMSPDTPYDAVCLAAAGLNRLRIAPEHAVDLPTDRFPTAAAQGAIAVQTRTDGTLATTVARLEHTRTRRAAEAERQFLRSIEAGCHTPAAAYATDEEGATLLRTQYFTPDGARFDAEARAADPIEAGRRCAQETLEWLSART
ncbi:MAG: hydroxymethylbilane synthase, partial [Planctomycetota bacterium]